MKPKIYDITPKISPRLEVFPGDVPFSRAVAMSFSAGHHLELSSINTTLHLGAHADAPSHYHKGGESIEQRPLSRYIGPAQLIRPLGLKPGERIVPKHVRVEISAKRVLFDTSSCPDPQVWNPQFNSLSVELLHWLADQGVFLVGIDTPSVDPADDKNLPAHEALYQRDFAVLEGLLLKDVPEGLYTLVALPLPIVGGDASPVRAVLLSSLGEFPEF